MTNEDTNRLKAAYKNHEKVVNMSDSRIVRRVSEKRYNSCKGCEFAHELGCYCEDGERWKLIGYED